MQQSLLNAMGKVEIESAVANVIARFHREQHGHAPAVAVTLVGDMLIARCSGVFTPTEVSLTQSEEGRKIVQSARRELRALTRRQVEAQVARAAQTEIVRSYFDLDVRVAEHIEVYVLGENLEAKARFEEMGLTALNA